MDVTKRVMGQEVVERQLAGGLTVVLLKKPGFAQKFAALATHYGGMDSAFVVPGQTEFTRVPDGIAHFLEHKLFEEPDGTDVSQRFSHLGMTSNAYTGSYYTVYHFSTADEFDAGLNLLLDFVQTPYFTDESVAKEQGIIGQEIQSGLDSPMRMAYYNFLESMYHHHPVRIRTIGSAESISKITKELLYQCHDTFYHPSNMMLVAVGDLDFAALIDLVEADLAARGYDTRSAIIRERPAEPEHVVQPEVRIQMKVSRPRLMMGFKGLLPEPANGTRRDHQRRLIAADLALSAVLGRITPLYWRLYEKAIVTEGFRYGYSAYQGAGYIWLDGESENTEAFIDELTGALEHARDNGLDPALFEAARCQEIGSFLSIIDEPEQLAGTYIAHRFNDLDFMETRQLLDEVKPADGQAFLAEVVRSQNRVVSVVEPL